ncbi:transmembrane protein 127-like [Cimex lectularius]|uniref:Transmembrane protein 127 transmembrane region domain-containing protein n=1 Tax=Cimex lectularius TaxID=79782 RepID=A0A8I6RD95_CIMLE|nr:transmembrane protein 127-like [Cimex lectularius]
MYSPEDPPRYRWAYPHDNERNHVAAIFHLFSVILTSTALFKMNWFKIWGSSCTHTLSLYQFMRLGYFETAHSQPFAKNGDVTQIVPVYLQYHTGNEVFDCVTPEVLNLMRVLIMLCILCIFHSMVGFALDVIGPSKMSLRFIRRNALPSIWSVLTVVTIVGVCYLVTRSLDYSMRTMYPTNIGMVTYENGCYTVTVAGAISLLATACNLLQDPPPPPEGPSRQRLVDDFEGLETFSVGMRNLPPPPPYTP